MNRDDTEQKSTLSETNNTEKINSIYTSHIQEVFQCSSWPTFSQAFKSPNAKQFAAQPHRCDARLTDFISGIGSTLSFKVGKELFGLYIRCLRSEYGEEPKEPYKYLSPKQRKFYADAEKNGCIRNKFFGGRKS
jgi:hypothetical protein